MTINPDSVYRQVMRQVNTFPAALEVLGAPLTGSDVRAYVMSGTRFFFPVLLFLLSRKQQKWGSKGCFPRQVKERERMPLTPYLLRQFLS
jgi:hypothetical protein